MQHIPLFVVCITIGGSTIGCASTPLTEAEEIAFQHEKEDKRLVKRDELIMFLNACDARQGLVIVEIIKSGRSVLPNSWQQSKAQRELGYKYTHNNVDRRARRRDFYCMYRDDLMRSLGYP